MKPEIESLVQQLIEAAEKITPEVMREHMVMGHKDWMRYLALSTPENITAVILAFREELKQARRDAIEEAVEILDTEGWLGESMQRIRALMEKPE